METKAANTDVNVEDNFSPENSQADSDSNSITINQIAQELA